MSETDHSELLNRVLNRVTNAWPLEYWLDAKILVAVSGGPDSVALLRILKFLRDGSGGTAEIVVAHCNHNTRPQSDADAVFVNQLSNEMGFEFRLGKRQPPTTDCGPHSNQSEESLRDFRYSWLFDTAKQVGARYIAVGHNADDQFETILFRLFRGTSISGLKGIPVCRAENGISIVRPLLSICRSEIIELLGELRQPYRTDDSNDNKKYTRNFLRHEIIPNLSKRFGPKVKDSILRLAEQAGEYEEFLDLQTDRFVTLFRTHSSHEGSVDIAELKQKHTVLIRHAVKRMWRIIQFPEQAMSQEKWHLVADLVANKKDATIELPGKIKLVTVGNELRFSKAS